MKNAGFGEIKENNITESRLATAKARKDDEAMRLLKAHPNQGKLIMLDEGGKSLSSREFSTLITSWLEERYIPHFAIGGPDGHGDDMKETADVKICFGRMTWPHRLARIMLSEQIYRALALYHDHPYHRD